MELPRLTVLNERFAIRSVLGELGPFEATYLAWDLENEEQVIVREYLPVDFTKRDDSGVILLPRSDEDEALFSYGLGRIAKESALVAKIDHPNVVRERESFQENGTIYRILDYHAGASLAYVLDQQGGKVSARTAVTILMPLMDGVLAGHAHGLVHGSICPEKIYLTKTGRPMLLSFKTTHLLLAQRTRKLESFQKSGFSPPEQYTPRGKHGPWSDVYGCGATLFTMLSGKQLPDVPARLREDTVPAMIDQAFDLSLGTRSALKIALDMNIARRPQSIGAFRAMLVDGFDLPGAHVPPPDDPPAKEPYRRPGTRMPEPQGDVLERPWAVADSIDASEPLQDSDVFEDPERFEKPEPLRTPEPVPERGPMHFPIRGKDSPLAMPVAKTASTETENETLPLEPVHFGNTEAPNGVSVYPDGFEDPIADFAPLTVPSTPTHDTQPAIYDHQEPIAAEQPGSWEREPVQRPRRNFQAKRRSWWTVIVLMSVGGGIFLTSFVYDRWQEQRASPYDPGNSAYMSTLLRGDSLFKVAETEVATDNWDDARMLFQSAKEVYSVALTLGTGNQESLQSRIDLVDEYLTKPTEIEIDEKESLAYIARGDSVLRAADQLNVIGDSVEARSLYMEARQEYMKVLDSRPDDSLATARLRQANQRLVAPIRVDRTPAPAPQISTQVSEEEQREQLYLSFKMQGDTAFDANDYALAKTKFAEALTYKPNDQHATTRIRIIDDRLAQTQKNEQYRQYMSSGNRFRSVGRLTEAKRQYENALQFKADDKAAQAALFEVDTLLDQQERKEQDYLSHKARGEVLLEKEDYANALASFNAALAAKPEDEYASLKVQEINETMTSLAKQEDELPEGMRDANGIYNYTEEPPVLVGGLEVLQSRLRYPPKAIEAGIEGRVSVRMIVDETGRMINPQILKGLRYDMDAEVLRVIRGAMFEPGRVGGQPVKSWYTLYFQFNLDQ